MLPTPPHATVAPTRGAPVTMALVTAGTGREVAHQIRMLKSMVHALPEVRVSELTVELQQILFDKIGLTSLYITNLDILYMNMDQ